MYFYETYDLRRNERSFGGSRQTSWHYIAVNCIAPFNRATRCWFSTPSNFSEYVTYIVILLFLTAIIVTNIVFSESDVIDNAFFRYYHQYRSANPARFPSRGSQEPAEIRNPLSRVSDILSSIVPTRKHLN